MQGDIADATMKGTVQSLVASQPPVYSILWDDGTEYNSSLEHFDVLDKDGEVVVAALQPLPSWYITELALAAGRQQQ